MSENEQSSDIVVAVDSSPASQQAAQEAAELAENLDSRVALVHAVERRIKRSGASSDGPIQESPDKAHENGEELLESVERTLATNVEVEHVLLEGEPISSFREHLTESQPQMIFIGHRALDEREEYLAGSFAKSLIGTSPVPVTVVTA